MKGNKRNRKRCFLLFALALVFFSAIGGCSRRRIEALKKEQLFSIKIGKGQEEIGISREKNGQFIGPASVLFRNGFFYIVDQLNQKLLKITTPGDVILVIAKGELQMESDDGNVMRTKERKSYPFNNLGQVAVDSDNNIYLEDRMLQKGPEKSEIDVFDTESAFSEGSEEVYVSTILKFDRLGRFQYRIGRSGINSEPFYYVYKIDVDDDGNLIVLTADDEWDAWSCYKYDTNGNLLISYTVSSSQVISSKGMENTAFFILDVLPARRGNNLMFWISQYDTSFDTRNIKKEEDVWGEEIEIKNSESIKSPQSRTSRQYQRDLLYYKLLYYNPEKRGVEKSFKWENKADDRASSPEELLGLDGRANGFMWKYMDASNAVVSIVGPNGTLITRRRLNFDGGGIWTNVHVSVDGCVSGIRVSDRELNFYRWRSDEVLNRKHERVSFAQFIRNMIMEFKYANRQPR